MHTPDADVTGLLAAHADGNEEALRELFAQVYRELQVLARRQRRRIDAGATLDTVALVGECYMKLARPGQTPATDRNHFFAVAACAMRHLLVDYAKSRNRDKRRGIQVTLEPEQHALDRQTELVLAVHQSLERLAAEDPRLVAVVDCRFFAGYSPRETAEALGLSERTVRRCWLAARRWIGRELEA